MPRTRASYNAIPSRLCCPESDPVEDRPKGFPWGLFWAAVVVGIIAFMLSSCTSSGGAASVQTVTKNPDGSTSTVVTPVLSPKEAAFHERCQSCLNSKF